MRSVLAMPELRLTARAATTHLDRAVSRIYGTELPDPGRFLSGGELVISGLLWLHDPRDVPRFVAALAEAGAAGLIACDADTGVIPPVLVAECERRAVPLLEGAVELSFAVITDLVGRELAAGRAGAGIDRGGHRRLLSAVTRRMGLDELLRLGAEQLGGPCWVLAPTGRVAAGAGPELPPATAARLVRAARRADRLPSVVQHRPDGPYTLVDVDEPGSPELVRWVLAVGGGTGAGAPDEDAIAELAGLIGLHRSRDLDGRRFAHRALGPLLASVRTGTAGPTEVAAAAAAAGLDPGGLVRVVSASAAGLGASVAGAVLEELVLAVDPAALVAVVGEEAYALLSADPGGPAEVSGALAADLAVLGSGLGAGRIALGVSSPAGIAELRGAVQEARQARRVGERRPGRTTVVAGEEIAVHQLLLATAPEELRRAVRRRVLGPVLDYDAEHGGDLIASLTAFLECSGSWTRAAARLHVHVNTLRYRIGRVEALAGVRVDEFPDRVDLYLALRATD